MGEPSSWGRGKSRNSRVTIGGNARASTLPLCNWKGSASAILVGSGSSFNWHPVKCNTISRYGTKQPSNFQYSQFAPQSLSQSAIISLTICETPSLSRNLHRIDSIVHRSRIGVRDDLHRYLTSILFGGQCSYLPSIHNHRQQPTTSHPHIPHPPLFGIHLLFHFMETPQSMQSNTICSNPNGRNYLLSIQDIIGNVGA